MILNNLLHQAALPHLSIMNLTCNELIKYTPQKESEIISELLGTQPPRTMYEKL